MQLRIRVGASTDASFNQVFKNLAQAAEGAQRKISSDERIAAKEHEAILKHKLGLEKENFKALISETSRVHKHLDDLEKMRLKSKLAGAKSAAKEEQKAVVTVAEATARELERIQNRLNREGARIAIRGMGGGKLLEGGGGRGRGGGGGMDGGGFGYRMGYWSMRNFAPVTPMLSHAARLASDVARGAGVDFGIGNMVGKQNTLQQKYVELSNQGYQETGSAERRVRQDPGEMQKEGMALAKQYGFDPEKIADATTKFVDLTGNLKGARAAMAGLASLSNATATDLSDMATAAASVQVQLDRAMGDDTQGKARALQSIMRNFAGEGKEGAVEIKNIAPQMAKISAMAPRFSGGIESVFGDLGVLAQESRKAGGSASAAQAATSIQRFADLAINPKTQKAFTAQMQKVGVAPESLFADKEKTKLRPIEEIILTALKATKGSTPAMQGLFKNVMANRAIEGFSGLYQLTKGTEHDKLKAVHEEYQTLKRATLSPEEEKKNNERVMQTEAKKAQVFQNQLQEIVGEMSTKLLPAMAQMAPKVLEMVDVFGRLTTWAAANPFEGVVALLGASILKAGIEQTIRAGIETAFSGGGRYGGGGGEASKGPGFMGNLGAFVMIASAATTMYEAGRMMIDAAMEEKAKKQKADIGQELTAGNAASQLKKEIALGNVSQDTINKAATEADNLQNAAMKGGDNRNMSVVDQMIRGIMRFSGQKDIVDKEDKEARQHQDEMLRETIALRQLISRGIIIRSLPPGDGPVPRVNDGARTNWVEP